MGGLCRWTAVAAGAALIAGALPARASQVGHGLRPCVAIGEPGVMYFSPAGRYLVADTTLGTCVWRADNHRLKFLRGGNAMAFSHDDRYAAVMWSSPRSDTRYAMAVLDTRSWRTLRRIELTGWAGAIAFSPDGRRLAWASLRVDGEGGEGVYVWTWRSGSPVLLSRWLPPGVKKQEGSARVDLIAWPRSRNMLVQLETPECDDFVGALDPVTQGTRGLYEAWADASFVLPDGSVVVGNSTASRAPPGGRSPDDWTVIWTCRVAPARMGPVIFRARYCVWLSEDIGISCAARSMKCLVWGRNVRADGRTLRYWLVDVRRRRWRMVLAQAVRFAPDTVFEWESALAALSPDGRRMAYLNPVHPRIVLFKALR